MAVSRIGGMQKAKTLQSSFSNLGRGLSSSKGSLKWHGTCSRQVSLLQFTLSTYFLSLSLSNQGAFKQTSVNVINFFGENLDFPKD